MTVEKLWPALFLVSYFSWRAIITRRSRCIFEDAFEMIDPLSRDYFALATSIILDL